jgi:hypothetical protein
MFLIQNFAFADSSAWWKCSVPFWHMNVCCCIYVCLKVNRLD